ncbi:MAG: hypothetical protein R2710_28145 [Acidimicrobiales bacterium]
MSHAAPAHHFGDLRGLFTSAAEVFERLNEAMRDSADIVDARDRLEALGKAYVRTALDTRPFRRHLPARPHRSRERPLHGVSLGAYRQLVAAIELVRDQCNPDLDVETAAITAWAMMPGPGRAPASSR